MPNHNDIMYTSFILSKSQALSIKSKLNTTDTSLLDLAGLSAGALGFLFASIAAGSISLCINASNTHKVKFADALNVGINASNNGDYILYKIPMVYQVTGYYPGMTPSTASGKWYWNNTMISYVASSSNLSTLKNMATSIGTPYVYTKK